MKFTKEPFYIKNNNEGSLSKKMSDHSIKSITEHLIFTVKNFPSKDKKIMMTLRQTKTKI